MQVLRLPRLYSETFLREWDQCAVDADLEVPSLSAERSFEHNSYMLEVVAAALALQ